MFLSKTTRVTVCLVLAAHVLLLAWAGHRDSPTYNEPAHLVAGISHWELGRFELYRVNPPLVRMVAAIPSMLAGLRCNWDNFFEEPGARPTSQIARTFCNDHGPSTARFVTLGRWFCIPFSVIGALVCFAWSKECYGERAGLVALVTWCFSPSVLGHGHVIVADAHAASLGVLAAYTFWKCLRQSTWSSVVIAGVCLGLALLAKTTLLVFLVLWPATWIVYRWLAKIRFEPARIAGLLAVAIFTVNFAYAFEGSGKLLGQYRFVSEKLSAIPASRGTNDGGNRFANTALHAMPVPFPRNYVAGIDIQMRDFEHMPRPSYLRGEFKRDGWWYYYLYAAIIKVPIGFWILFALAIVWHLKNVRAASWQNTLAIVAPAATILATVSMQTGFSHHLRYALPAFPFLFVFCSSVGQLLPAKRTAAKICMVGLSWAVASSLTIFPHSLSYFNESVGGPRRGWLHLLDSNLDWGQDFHVAADKLTADALTPKWLAYYGSVSPHDEGYEFSLPPEVEEQGAVVLPQGLYAVSANLVMGYAIDTFSPSEGKHFTSPDAFGYFRRLVPDDYAGYSIYLYRVTEPVKLPPPDDRHGWLSQAAD